MSCIGAKERCRLQADLQAVRQLETARRFLWPAELDWIEAGLWLIGVGSLVVVTAIIAGAPRAADGGLVFRGPLSTRRGRLWFAVEATGLAHVALGSVIVAVVEFPDWRFAVLTVGTVAAGIYLLAAWKQHQYRGSRLEGRETFVDNEEQRWRAACVQHCSTWRWSFLHPFEERPWPLDCLRLPEATERLLRLYDPKGKADSTEALQDDSERPAPVS